MKLHTRLLPFALLLLSPSAFAAKPDQDAKTSDGKNAVSLTNDAAADARARQIPGQALPPKLEIPAMPKVAVTRKWDEREATVHVRFTNTGTTAINLQGVQTTGSLYVVDFPKRVKSGDTGDIVVAYAASVGADSDTDLVRLLTDQGVKSIQVVQNREQVLSLDTRKLDWKVGAATTTKSAVVTLAAGTSTLVSARALGSGNKAQFTSLGGGRYRIDVTPGSTAKAAQFPVLLEFKPQITGVPNLIVCTIAAD